jgi:putative endonuclease
VHYVYLLISARSTNRHYVGPTTDLKRRLAEHNCGKSLHTARLKPWRLVTYVAFSRKQKATDFERYLKSGSGHAFAKRYLR